MPIKKRPSQKQRIKRKLPKGYRAVLRHPLLCKLTYGDNPIYNPGPEELIRAIDLTKKWKGASWEQKIFVLAFDLVLEKATGTGVLDAATADRLHSHLESNQSKIQSASYGAWMLWCWDIWHDHYGLYDIEAGELDLPKPITASKPRKRVKPKPAAPAKPKRKRIKKHAKA